MVLGGLSLLWQIVSWRLSHRTAIDVQVNMGLLLLPARGTQPAVLVTAINRSAHPVRITGVSIRVQDGTDRWLQTLAPLPGDEIPGIVAPHDSGQAHLNADDLAANGIDVTKPVVARVIDASGKPFLSKPKPLLKKP